ncbi:heme peroxidase [Amylocarpus encephaloides]|uniref:Peroxidase n=1 Tax=Amylocarpus encephaloides TaxID=45428 RepID=A0A9P7Y5T4_9HELO|nr:heme peroxidase [Amylocarpus encephaloides]
MKLTLVLALLAQANGIYGQAVDANGITLYEKIEEMERQILQPFTLNSLVSPCSNNQNGPPEEQEQTAAQWVRILFHDVITKNVEGPGLGGLDASIGFETDRPENIGQFANITLIQFALFSSVFLSMADLIALGVSDSLATCDQPLARRIPLRVGRIDATRAGPAGVPGPADSLAFAQTAFTRAGFTNSEMIQAVACGHSLGGVHQTNFPDIVPESQKTPENTEGRSTFDSTPNVFDNTGVNEYISGVGLKGGPLVVGANETTRSDLRIFKSDNNVTINAMNTPGSFEQTCLNIFEKMSNTVPSGVTLSAPIVPRPWIMRESHLDLTPLGIVTFQGTISAHGATEPPATASYFYGTEGGGNTGPKTSQTGAAIPIFRNTQIGFGTIKDYAFFDTFNSPTIQTINVQGQYSAPINLNIFLLPSQTFTLPVRDGPGGAVLTNRYLVRAAVKGSLVTAGSTVSATLWYPTTQQGSVVPKIATLITTLTLEKTVGPYKIFKAVIIQPGAVVIFGGAHFFQIKLGTTQTSAKISSIVFNTTCTAPDPSGC